LLSKTLEQWARIMRTDQDKTLEILRYIQYEKIGDVCENSVRSNGKITVICRRMYRLAKDRENNRLRQQKHYEKTKSNKNITPPSSSSSSSSSITELSRKIDNSPRVGEKSPEGDEPKRDDEKDKIKAKKKEQIKMANEAIDLLNNAGKRSFRKTEANRKYIIARFNEGFTLDDVQKVLNYKRADEYFTVERPDLFRPATLFGTKFESYLQAAKAGTPTKMSRQVTDDEIERIANEYRQQPKKTP